MAFDGIVTKAITTEITPLCGARIDKVFEPNKNEIILGLYLNGCNYALNICIEAQNCRINLTTHSKPNPQIAPNFCMLLRKNLIGLKLKNIITFDLERLIILEFEGFDELDDIISKKLVIELMGKHSNIILLDDNNVIIDSLRHIKEIDENYRDILPHTKYTFPTSDKNNFLELSNFEAFLNIIISNFPDILESNNINDLANQISSTFNGISKSFINSIINKYQIEKVDKSNLEIIFNHINTVINNIGTDNLSFESIKNKDGIIKDYFLTTEKNSGAFNLNFYIDDFYYSKETNENFKNYRNSLLKLILDTLKKYNKRLEHINQKLKECDDMDKYRIWGELITANLYRIPNKNVDMVEVENYYDNNNLITIPLDVKYAPNMNARRYFKKYSKLKNAFKIVSEQKLETEKEIDYIESIKYELESAITLDELKEVSEEIKENAIFKEKIKKGKKNKNTKKAQKYKFSPIEYEIDGFKIYVGRNNKENDWLTLSFAQKTDIWFHTKDIHGSHVILKADKPISDDILVKAAEIAAKHSQAKESSNVPVDYCKVQYVKKPNGSKPGMVIFTNNKTLNVNPLKA